MCGLSGPALVLVIVLEAIFFIGIIGYSVVKFVSRTSPKPPEIDREALAKIPRYKLDEYLKTLDKPQVEDPEFKKSFYGLCALIMVALALYLYLALKTG